MNNESTKKCIYCQEQKHVSKFSLEHIFPDSLGGSACPPLFKTDKVCAKCNNDLGLFVDANFLKSWFVQNSSSLAAFHYLDPVTGGIIPYIYIGIVSELSNTNEDCEFWVGPSGESVYCLRQHDDRYATYAGGDPIASKKIGRDVVLYGVSKSNYWMKVGVFSFYNQFKKDRRYGANINLVSNHTGIPIFMQPDERARKFISDVETLRTKSAATGEMLSCNFAINEDFYERFLAKFALGLGCSLLTEDFQTSDYANNLRAAMRTSSFSKRRDIPLRGTGFWDRDEKFDKMMEVGGAHTILIQRIGNRLGVYLSVYGKGIGLMVITDEYERFKTPISERLENGVVFVVVPTRTFCTQEIPLAAFVAHKTSSYKVPDLLKIEQMYIELDKLPPRER